MAASNGTVARVWASGTAVSVVNTLAPPTPLALGAKTLVATDDEAHPMGRVASVAFSPNSRYVAAVTSERGPVLWDLQAGGEPSVLGLGAPEYNGRVVAVGFTPCGQHLLLATEDKEVVAWDLASLADSDPVPLAEIPGQALRFGAVAFADSGRLAAATTALGVWDTTGPAPALLKTFDHRNATVVAVSPDGRLTATGYSNGETQVMTVADGKTRPALDGPRRQPVRALAFSRDGKRLAICYPAETYVWTVATRDAKLLKVLPVKNGAAAAFSPCGAFVATAGEDRLVTLWGIDSADALVLGAGTTDDALTGGGAVSLAFNRKGTAVVAGTAHGTVVAFSVAFGQETKRVTGMSAFDAHECVTEDGEFCVLVADAPSSVPDGVEAVQLAKEHGAPRHMTGITAAALCPADGTTLATGTNDGRVGVWTFATEEVEEVEDDECPQATAGCKCNPCTCDPCKCGATAGCQCDPCECNPCECGAKPCTGCGDKCPCGDDCQCGDNCRCGTTKVCECDPCTCNPCKCGTTSGCQCDPCTCDPCECVCDCDPCECNPCRCTTKSGTKPCTGCSAGCPCGDDCQCGDDCRCGTSACKCDPCTCNPCNCGAACTKKCPCGDDCQCGDDCRCGTSKACECHPCTCNPCRCGTTSGCQCDPCTCDPCKCVCECDPCECNPCRCTAKGNAKPCTGCGDKCPCGEDCQCGDDCRCGTTSACKCDPCTCNPCQCGAAKDDDDEEEEEEDEVPSVELQKLEAHRDTVTTLAFSPDGETLVSGSDDGKAIVWSLEAGAKLELIGHKGGVSFACVSPDSRLVLSACDDLAIPTAAKTAFVWDIASGQKTPLADHSPAVSACAFSPDGKHIATGSWATASVAVWDVRAGASLGELDGHAGSVTGAAFSPDGSLLATTAEDNRAAAWVLRTGAAKCALIDAPSAVTAVAVTPNGNFLALGFASGRAAVYEVTGQLPKLITGGAPHEASVTAVALTGNGLTLLSCDYSGAVCYWQLGAPGGKPARYDLRSPVPGPISAAAFNGPAFATASGPVVTLWSAARTPVASGLVQSLAAVSTLDVAPNAAHAVAVGSGAVVAVVAAVTGQSEARVLEGMDAVTFIRDAATRR